jgi:hypothetical protein
VSLGAPELDAATADAIAGEVGRASRHALPPGTPCANCATPLAGPWCHACGQKGEDYHRSIRHLAAEAFEGLTHFDGRFWQTVPRLVRRPGELTRDYLDGHRAAQIPPFRLFLVVLVLVFFTGGLSFGHGGKHARVKVANPEQATQLIQKNAELTDQDKADLNEAMTQLGKVRNGQSSNAYVRERAEHAVKNPEAFARALEEWGHRFAILMLPISAAMLAVIFAFKRGVYVFDHLIFSMHSLSFQGLLLTAIFLGSLLSGWFWWLIVAAPVHLFFHMRATYRISTVGALVRMWLLFVGSAVAVGMLLLALVIVGAITAR